MKVPAAVIALLAFAFTSFAQEVTDVLRVQVELVQVYATVTDMQGRNVINLKQEHFQIFEDGVEQEIQAFYADDAPFSVGIVFDAGSGMKKHLEVAKESVLLFLKMGNIKNEYFFLEFTETPTITIDFTTDILQLQNHHEFLPSEGRNKAIHDAVYMGLEKLEDASNPSKLLLIVTSGGDTHSRKSVADVRELARQRDVQIYGVSPPVEVDLHASEPPVIGAALIESLGGQGYAAAAGYDFQDLCMRIAVAVRNQYAFSYVSTNPERDGKFRTIRLQVNLPEGMPELFVHTRSGYYAPGGENRSDRQKH